MIKTILFDVDGVVLIGEKFSFQYEKDFGLEPGVMTEFFIGPFQDCKIGEKDMKEELQPYLKKWNWGKGVDEFLQYWFPIEIKLNEELLLKVKELQKKGIVCGLATSQEKYRLEYLKKELDFESKFDSIFCSCEIGVSKPSIVFFEKIFERLDCEKDEVLFFDSHENNVEAAREFGFQSEKYTSLDNFAKYGL